MAFTFPLELPALPGFAEMVWSPDSAVDYTQSPFNFKGKTYVWDGQVRRLVCKCPPMGLSLARKWQATMHKLNGMEGTFFLYPQTTPNLGSIAEEDTAYSPYIGVSGGGVGTSLTIDGVPNKTALFRQGDWISIQGRLYQILDDANSSAGSVVVNVWPFIRTAIPNYTPVRYGTSARGVFKLLSWPEFPEDVEYFMHGFSFSAQECLESDYEDESGTGGA